MLIPRVLSIPALALGAAMAVGLAGASAQTAGTKAAAAPEKPAAVPVKAVEASEIKTFTLASEGELADMTYFASLYSKLATKPTGATAQAVKMPKYTMLPRTKTVIVRGTKAELEQAEAIIKLIQGTADPKGTMIAKLKTAKVDEVVAALTNLELDGRVFALRNSNSLVMLPGFDADAEQVKKVIEAFEKVDAKTAASKTNPVKPRDDD
jgi:hypothetical protein